MVAGGFTHGGVDRLKDLAVHIVDQVIALKHGLRHVNIGSEKCIQCVPHHADAELGHARDVHIELRIRARRQVHDALSDVYGLVTHALQISVDLDAGDHEAQIRSEEHTS